jgi:two-component system chemotaxis response regulator CheY
MLNIMVVDDSMIIRKGLTTILKELGFNVVGEAGTGAEAVALYDMLKPDLVTMDITMPVMTGNEALKRIKAKHPDAKIIMITSHGEEQLVMEAILAGAKGYVLKPITQEKLRVALCKVVPEAFIL